MRPADKTFAEAAPTPSLYGKGTVSICRRGSILIAAIDRIKTKNALSDDVYEDLIGVLEQTKIDPTLSAVVWTGAGSYFSSGADVNDGHFESGNNKVPESILNKPGGRFMLAIVNFPKILCGAVNGPIIGIAATALMQCDLVYFTEQAFFWAPFTRLALVPELTSSATFLETMGLSKANELLLLGKRINAQKALEWGICSQVLSDCDKSGNPFHANSLASRMSQELDKRLLSLPNGAQTAQVFCELVKGGRRSRMHQVLLRELAVLDQRFQNGEVWEAAKQLSIGKSTNKKAPRSRL